MNRGPSSVSSYPSVGEFAADDSPRSQSIGSLPQSQNGTPQPVLNDGYNNYSTENQLYRGLSPNDAQMPATSFSGERFLSTQQRPVDSRFLSVPKFQFNQSQQMIGSNKAPTQRPIALPLLHMPPQFMNPVQLVPYRSQTQMQLPQFAPNQPPLLSSQRGSFQLTQGTSFRPIAVPNAGPQMPPPAQTLQQQPTRSFEGIRPIPFAAARQTPPPLLHMPPADNNYNAVRLAAAVPPPPPRLLPPELVMGFVHAKQAEELQRLQQQAALESSLKATQNVAARPPLPLLTMPPPAVTQRPPFLIPSARPPAPPPAPFLQPPPAPETSEEIRDVDLDNVLKQLNDGYLLKPGLVSELLMRDTGERRPRGVNWLTAKHEDVERELEHEVLLKSLLEKEQLVQTLKRDRHLLETQVQQQQQQMASSMPLAMPPVAPPEVYLSRSTRTAAESAPPAKRGDMRLLNVMDIEAPEAENRAGEHESAAKPKPKLTDHLTDLLDRIGRERREELARAREPNPLAMRAPSVVDLRERPPPPPAEPPLVFAPPPPVDEAVSARAVADERAVPQHEPAAGGDALTARLLQSEPVKDERVIEDALKKARNNAEKSEVSRTLVGMDAQLRAMEQLSARLDEDMRVAQQRVLVAEQLARSETSVARQLEDPRLFERTHGARSNAVTLAAAIGRAEARDRSHERPLKAPDLREIMGIKQTRETAVETLPPQLGAATQTTPREPPAEEPSVVQESVAPPKSAAEIEAEQRRAKIRERIDRLLKGKTVSPRDEQPVGRTRVQSGSAPPTKSRALSPERQAQMQESMRKHEESAYRLVMGSLEEEALVKRQLAALQSRAPRGRQTATDHIVRDVRADKKRQSALEQRNSELKRRVVAKTTAPKPQQPEDVGERSMSREEYDTFLDRMMEQSPNFDTRQPPQPKPAKPLEDVVAMRRPEELRKQYQEKVKRIRDERSKQQQRPLDAQNERTRSPPRIIGSPVASAKPTHENWAPKTEQRPRQSVPYVEMLKRGRPPATAARSSSAVRSSSAERSSAEGKPKGPTSMYLTREVHSALSPQETPREAVAAAARRTHVPTTRSPVAQSPLRQQQSALKQSPVRRTTAPEAEDISEMSEWTVSDDVKRILREPDTGRSLETATSEQFSRDAEWDAALEPTPAPVGGSSLSSPKRPTRSARDTDERSHTPSIIDWDQIDNMIGRDDN